MPAYKVHRLREAARQQFRWAPHTSGVTTVKAKDYEPDVEVEGESPYAVWVTLRDSDTALQIGDILETAGGELRIFKYIGFEEAHWFVPEPVPVQAAASAGEV